jgi:hypothetical protein
MTDLVIFGFGFVVCLIVGAGLTVLIVQSNRDAGSVVNDAPTTEVQPALVHRRD